MSDNYIYKIKRLNELNRQECIDYLKVLSEVYECILDYEYLKNRYGDNKKESIIILVYDVNKPIALQTFVEDAFLGQKVFQSGDSATLKEYRGKGIFSECLNLGEAELINYVIFGFPNNNSYMAFIKRGWTLDDERKYKLTIIPKIDDFITKIEPSSVEKMSKTGCFKLRRIRKKYYLFRIAKNRPNLLIGYIDEKYAKLFSKTKSLIFFSYSSKGKLGKGIKLISKNNNGIKFPLYKLDTLYQK